MANERDFELLDDYLTNRLSEQDRSAFEQKLQADPDLQHEYALQKRVIQGIKDARVAQLKSMLNQVPVPSASTGNAIATKVILGTLVTLMIAAAAFWYYRDEPAKVEQTTASSAQEQPTAPAETPVAAPETKRETKEQTRSSEKATQDADKNQTSAGTEHSRPSLAKKPAPLSSPAPSNEAGELKSAESIGSIETDNSNATLRFHYKLTDGALVLFGPFEQRTYEVVEIAEGGKSVRSLYFGNKYYLLAETNDEVRALTQLTDASLVQKFEKQRIAE